MVGDGVAGVQLDGGEDSLTGRSSGSKGSSNSNSWGGKRSSNSSGKTSIGKAGIGSSDSRDSMSNVSNNGTGSSGINTTEKTSTKTVSSGIWVRKDSRGGNSSDLIGITPPSLNNSWGGFGSGGSSIISSSKFSLSSSNLRGVNNSNWEGEIENGSNKRSDFGSNSCDGKVGSGNSESVDGIGDVVHCLQKSVSINVLVGAGGVYAAAPGAIVANIAHAAPC